MAASQEQKVDFLLKKIGYVASKTGIAEDESSLSGTKKAPFGEAIPSPLVVPSTSVWADSSFIPSTPPGSSTGYVQVYLSGTSGHRMTVDSTVSGNRTFIAHSTYNNTSSAILGDWIDTSFSADYIIKVYKGDPNSGGVQLSAAGSGSNDTWFFDYSSGVLNFNGTQVPSGVTSSNIYIVGYRYIGTKGIQFPAGVTTATSLSVSGITTFTGLVDANGGVTANTLIVEDLTDNRVVIAGSGGELEDDANFTFDGAGLVVGANLNVSGVSTFQSSIHLGDNDSIKFGANNDLYIYSVGGGQTRISQENGGLLNIRNKVPDQDVVIQTDNGNGGGNIANYFRADGSTGEVKLFHYGTLKFATKSTGIQVTGTASATTLSTGAVGTGINIGVSSITGPAEIIIDPAGVGDNTGTVRIAGDLQVDGTTVTLDTTVTEVDKLEVGANNTTVGVAITQSGTGDILNLYDGSTEVFSVEDGGRIVATATNSVIPFLYSTYADLPSASTYHGAFAHVHATGKAYFAHAGNWIEIVSKETSGTVGTGTETYSVGAATFSGDVSVADKIVHTGDTNTSIRFLGPDTITAETAGSERLRITNSGLVGIGTVNPSSALEIRTTTTNAVTHYRNNASNGGAYFGVRATDLGAASAGEAYVYSYNSGINLLADGNGHIDFATGGTASKVRITSGGSVGIGTDNPNTTLHLSSATPIIKLQDSDSTGNAALQRIDAVHSGGTTQWFVGQNSTSTTELWIQNVTNDDIRFGTNNTERLRITSDGRIGIGVVDPGYELEIGGSSNIQIALTANTTSGNSQVYFGDSADDDAGALIYRHASDSLAFNVNAFEVMRLNSSGNIGIGTNNPALRAHIFSTANADAALIESTQNFATLRFKSALNTSGPTVGIDGGGGLQLDQKDTSKYIAFSIGSERLRILNDGKVRVPDNGKFVAGAGDDLRLYHNATNSYIENYTGNLYIFNASDDKDIHLQSDNGSGGLADYILCDGSTGEVVLSHYGNTKLATTTTGINVTGTTDTDNLIISGTVSAGSSTGNDGQYLISTGVGVSWTTLPTARTNTTITAAEDQTSFPFNYNVGFVDVFYNGVKLADTEFTASNGTHVVLNDVAYAGDVVELISYATAASGGGGGGASNLNGLADVTITGSPIVGETLQHNGTKFVNDFTVTQTTTSTSEVTILGLDVSEYRSVEYQIQVTEGSNYHTTKILAIHNGTAASHNEFGTLSIGTVPATFDVDISGSNMRLLATPASSNSTVFKVKFTGIKV